MRCASTASLGLSVRRTTCSLAPCRRTITGKSSRLSYANSIQPVEGAEMVDRLKGKVALVVGAGSIGPGWGNGETTAVGLCAAAFVARTAANARVNPRGQHHPA